MIKRVRNLILREMLQLPVLQNITDLAYHEALEKHARHLPLLSGEDSLLVKEIAAKGVFITNEEKLGIQSTSRILQSAENLLPRLRDIEVNKNDFTIHATSAQIMEYPELFLWGLEERLLDIVENYLGLPVAYHGVYFRRDFVNQIQERSRLWHIDMEDHRVLKIIVYLNDIHEECGPFQYIPQHLTTLFCDALKYSYGYLKDETVQSVIPVSDWQSCVGKKGTVTFVDTGSVLHRGKIPEESDRYALFFDYTSRQPKHEFYCKSSLPMDDLRKLEHLSQRQKECIFWRNPSLI
jgi:hypothetical protein